MSGDELAVYKKLSPALVEKIPVPDLVVYLRADPDTLMARIAQRNRPYERGMDQNYIDNLRLAYGGFFAAFTAAPVLTLDFNHLDIVRDPDAFATVRDRIATATAASAAAIPPHTQRRRAGCIGRQAGGRASHGKRRRQSCLLGAGGALGVAEPGPDGLLFARRVAPRIDRLHGRLAPIGRNRRDNVERGTSDQRHLAKSTARVSRITVTRIWPGYCIVSWILAAISFDRRMAARSSISSGLTAMRTSRPAWMAYDCATP